MRLRPIVLAKDDVVTMHTSYPPNVDLCKPTFGGLPSSPLIVDHDRMSTVTTAPFSDDGERLIRLRTSQSDLSQKAWAEKHGFNGTQYNNWETGKRRIPVDAAEKLCDAYGLTLDFVYRGRRDGLPDSIRKVF